MKALSILNLTSLILTFIFLVTTTFISSFINHDLIMVNQIKENHSVPIIYDKFKNNKENNNLNAFYYYQPRLKQACYYKDKKMS